MSLLSTWMGDHFITGGPGSNLKLSCATKKRLVNKKLSNDETAQYLDG